MLDEAQSFGRERASWDERQWRSENPAAFLAPGYIFMEVRESMSE